MSERPRSDESTPPSATAEAQTTVAPRPRRRWLRRVGIGLGVLVLLLAILIGLAPTLISTRAGVDYLESMVNARLFGALKVGEVSLGWGGPTEVRDVRVLDADKREVVKVAKITAPAGVWGLITSGLNFGEIVIEAPRVDLYVSAINDVSLTKALGLRNPAPQSASGPLPEPRGRIVVRRGTIHAVRDDGATYELGDVDAEFDLQTLSTVSGKLAIKLADGVPLTAEADLRELVSDGAFQLDRASGKIAMRTGGPADIGRLAAFLTHGADLSGAVQVDAQATLAPGDIAADFGVVVSKLQTRQRAAARAAPLDLELRGRGQRTGDAVTARADLTGAAGNARADLTYRSSTDPIAITSDQVISAILTGAPLSLPDFGVDVQGSLDLAKLQEAVPGILNVRDGLVMTGGKLEITKVSARGGTAPTAAGSISLSGLSAQRDGKAVQLQPISLAFDTALERGKGLQIARAELKSNFAELTAKGAASDLQATFRGSLAKLQQELGQIFDLSGLDLAGEFSGELQVARAGDERVYVSLKTGADGLRFGRGDARFDLQKLSVQQTGFLTLTGEQVTRFDMSKADADLDGQVTASVTGWYDFKQQGFRAVLDLTRADLAFAASRADALGVPTLKRYAGTLSAQVSVDRTAAARTIKCAGSLAARSLTVDGEPALDGDAVLSWSGVSVGADGGDVSADLVKLASSAANLDLTGLRWGHGTSNGGAVTTDAVLSAVLSGTPLSLPDFALNLAGNADLPRLQKLLPEFIKVRPGQQITGGRLTIAKASARGGAEPVVAGKLELTELSASDGGKAIQIAPISFVFDAALKQGSGLQIGATELKSSFAELTATGAASDLQAAFRGNLAKMQQELGQVFDLSGFELAGEFDGTVKVARASDERIDVSLQANANGLKAGGGSKRFELQRATMRQAGFLTLAGQTVGRFDVSEAGVDLDGQVLANATGSYDFQQQGFRAALEIKRADLGFAASRAAALGIEDLKRYAGAIAGKATVERSGAGQPITSSGGLTTQNLSVDAKPLLERDAKLDWAGVSLAAAGDGLTAESIKLESSAANLNAKTVRWRLGESMELSADVDVSADLRPCFAALAAVAKLAKPPAVAGKFTLTSHVSTSNDVVTIKGTGGIDQLEVGAGEQTIREPRVDFEIDGQLDQPKERLALAKCTLKSAPLTAELSGAVDQYKTACVLALKGRYDAAWDQVTTLLHEFVPATAQTVIVKGKSSSQFEIAGPLHAPGATSTFRNLTGGAEVGWASAEVYGLALGIGKLAPTLRDGQFTLPTATIPTAEGKVNLGATIDFTPAEPTLNMPGKLQILDRVAITPQLGQSLLSRINPIFMHMTRIEGRASLHTQDVLLPLGDSIKKSGNGSGQLDLASVKMQPAGLMGQLIALAGASTGTVYAVQFGSCDFQLKDGRIRYDNFTMTFPENFDLMFRGSVGFDETLDLIVSVPVRAGLLEKLGVSGSAAQLARQLDGVRVDIPITGTRDRPVLETAKVNTENLLKGLLTPKLPEGGLEKGVGDLLKGLGGGKKEPKPKKNP